MSRRAANKLIRRNYAPVFAALGDETRLAIVRKLADGQSHSISDLTQGAAVTRQAITKHLLVLESVGIVHSMRSGRENLFELDARPIGEVKSYLDLVSRQWDETLSRLKDFIEK